MSPVSQLAVTLGADPWKPASTAPRTGVEILAFTPRYGIIEVWCEDGIWVSNAVEFPVNEEEGIEIEAWMDTFRPPPRNLNSVACANVHQDHVLADRASDGAHGGELRPLG